MTEADLIAECESVLYPLLVREHAQHPLYVVPFDAVEDLPRLEALGWASYGPFMDPCLIDRVEDYRGPGPVIMLDLISIGAVAARGCFERCVRNVFIHELAHPQPMRAMLEPPPTDRARDMSMRVLKRQAISAEPEAFTPENLHNRDFIRYATHLAFRATQAGVDFTTHRLFSQGYEYSPYEVYLPTLQAECERMSDATFVEIEGTEPPTEFTQLFDRDMLAYRNRLQEAINE